MEQTHLNKEKIYLPGLNGIRAIAALAVVFSHTNGHLGNFGLTTLPYLSLAGFGVTIFFTLSGFLITFLLFKEIDKTGTVEIKKFYARRILRIWPLYYFYLFVILAVVGYGALGKTFFMYLAILPNIANAYVTYNALPWEIPTATAMFLIGHYWSLGVEEQFYSFWPWLIKKIKNILPFLILFPIAFLALKIIAKYMHFSEPIQFVLHYSRFGCLGIGALGAYLYWSNHKILKYLKPLGIQILPWVVLLIVALNRFHIFSIIDHEIVSLFMVILIINQISGYKKIINLENKVFDYLGKISFGIYVYNPLVIFILYSIISKYFELSETLLSYMIIYSLVVFTNILFAHLSYYTIERFFLKLKSNFITVKSIASKEEFNEK